jgi:N-acetylgalactosamine kinase
VQARQNGQRLCDQTMVVTLAAGSGTRMGRDDLVKVCFEIDSAPALNRQIGVFRKRGFQRFLIVVGTMAEQVLQTVTRDHPTALYVFTNDVGAPESRIRVACEALALMPQSWEPP